MVDFCLMWFGCFKHSLKGMCLNVFSLVLEQAPTSQPHVRQLSSASTYCLCLSHFRPISPFHFCETVSSRHSCLIPKLYFPFSIWHVPTPFIVLVFDNIPYLAPQWVLGSPIFQELVSQQWSPTSGYEDNVHSVHQDNNKTTAFPSLPSQTISRFHQYLLSMLWYKFFYYILNHTSLISSFPGSWHFIVFLSLSLIICY